MYIYVLLFIFLKLYMYCFDVVFESPDRGHMIVLRRKCVTALVE